MRGLMGTFALMPLQEVVDLLARRAASGSLVCERGTVRKTLHFVEGVAVSAASNDPREYLGQLLINFGHIDEEQLAKAFRTQEETKVRLGNVLAMVGLVPPETIRETLAIKIRETVLDAFLWDSGVFQVDDASPPAPDELDARVALSDISREAEFRTAAWAAFRAQFPAGAAMLRVDEERARAIPAGRFDDTLLRLAREGRTIDEIGVALHTTDFHLYQRLYALKGQGVIEAAPREARPSDGVAHARSLLAAARVALDEGEVFAAEDILSRAVDAAPGLESARALLADARQRLAAVLRTELLGRSRPPRLRVALHDVALMRLPAAEKYLLARCDGERDVEEILALAPMTELSALKALKRMAEGKLLELG